jgi:hypothetical protein
VKQLIERAQRGSCLIIAMHVTSLKLPCVVGVLIFKNTALLASLNALDHHSEIESRAGNF